MPLVYSFLDIYVKSWGCRLYQKIIQKYLATPRMLMISAAPMTPLLLQDIVSWRDVSSKTI